MLVGQIVAKGLMITFSMLKTILLISWVFGSHFCMHIARLSFNAGAKCYIKILVF